MASLADIVYAPQGPGKPYLRDCGHIAPLPHTCKNCALRACDNCADYWRAVCSRCSGDICVDCETHAKQRWLPREKKHEYLCRQCAPVQAKALKDLCRDVESAIHASGVWLSDVVAEVEEALRLAKEAL